MKDNFKFQASKDLAKLVGEGLQATTLFKTTLYDAINKTTKEIQERGRQLVAEEEVNTHRDAYVKVLTTTHNYSDVSDKVFSSEKIDDGTGELKSISEEKLKLLVSYHLGKGFLETILIPLSGNAIQTLTTNLTKLAIANISRVLKGKKAYFPEGADKVLENFSQTKFKRQISKDTNNVIREDMVPEKLSAIEKLARNSKINGRLHDLKNSGWKVIENYFQQDEKTRLPSVVVTLFKLKDEVGTVLTLTIDNNAEWSSEREKLSLLSNSWINLLDLWYTKNSEKEELMKEYEKELSKTNKENE